MGAHKSMMMDRKSFIDWSKRMVTMFNGMGSLMGRRKSTKMIEGGLRAAGLYEEFQESTLIHTEYLEMKSMTLMMDLEVAV